MSYPHNKTKPKKIQPYRTLKLARIKPIQSPRNQSLQKNYPEKKP